MDDEIRSEIASKMGVWTGQGLSMALLGVTFGSMMVAGMAFLEQRFTGLETLLAVSGTLVVASLAALGVYLATRYALPRVVLWAHDGDPEQLLELGDAK